MAMSKEGVLFWKSVKRAATSAGPVWSGAGALGVSLITANPLPLILWGVGAGYWSFNAAAKGKYAKQILDEEHARTETRVKVDRDAVINQLRALLAREPFARWTAAGQMPDYLATYDQLARIRDEVADRAHSRKDVQDTTEDYILKQLDTWLAAFLQFVQGRVACLQSLTGVRVSRTSDAPVEPARLDTRGRINAYLDGSDDDDSPSVSRRRAPRRTRTDDAANIIDRDVRIREFDNQIAELRKLIAAQPSTEKTRQGQINTFEKYKAFLMTIKDRDDKLVAQLEGFPLYFNFALDSMKASQISVSEISDYMGSAVEQIEETRKFVESMQPMIDQWSAIGAPALTETQ